MFGLVWGVFVWYGHVGVGGKDLSTIGLYPAGTRPRQAFLRG